MTGKRKKTYHSKEYRNVATEYRDPLYNTRALKQQQSNCLYMYKSRIMLHYACTNLVLPHPRSYNNFHCFEVQETREEVDCDYEVLDCPISGMKSQPW